jgi:hypothetical protein
MIIGTKGHFGIEFDFRRQLTEHFFLGDLWLWANDHRIGDELSSVELSYDLDCLSGPIYIRGHRYVEIMDRLSKEDAVDLFYRFICEEDALPEEMADFARHFRRNLVVSANDMEGFDSVFVILLGCKDGGDRLIWRTKESKITHEVLLDSGEYDGCVLACYDKLEELTGYRSVARTWLGLSEHRRDEIRRSVLRQNPSFGRPDRWEQLEGAAMDESNKRKSKQIP